MQSIYDARWPSSKSEARSLGVACFFSGEICKNGHLDLRSTKTGGCTECNRERSRKWSADFPDLKKARDKEYASKNKEKIKKYLQAWKRKNPDYQRDWLVKNPGYSKLRKSLNAGAAKLSARLAYTRSRLNPQKRIESSIRAGVVKGIKKGSKSSRRTFDLLGYNLHDLMKHLESVFLPGMTWGNYGKWHIDHQIPLSAHNYQTPDDIDFKKAWALLNLRPMWAADNIRKHAKLTAPFQPSLAIAN